MRRLLLFLISLLVFTACQGEEKIVYVKFDDSEGLSTDHKVLLNGVSVGEVIDVDITSDYQVLASIQLSDSIDFPKDTQFEIQSQDLFTKMILVTLGEWNTYIENGDTIQGVFKTNPHQTPHDTETPPLLKDLKEMLKN